MKQGIILWGLIGVPLYVLDEHDDHYVVTDRSNHAVHVLSKTSNELQFIGFQQHETTMEKALLFIENQKASLKLK